MQTRSTKTATRPQRTGKVTGKPDDKEQSRAFIEKAHEIEADEEYSVSDELMKRMAKTKPDPHVKQKSKAT
jgi:hypothetical protein